MLPRGNLDRSVAEAGMHSHAGAWEREMISVAITDVCDFQGGTQPPKSEWSIVSLPNYIRMLQIRDFTQAKESHIGYVKNKGTLKTCNKDDILIGRYGASIGKILTGLSGAYNVAIVKTIPDLTKLDRSFLFHLLKGESFQRFIQNIGSRAAQAGFNKKELTKFRFQLPPLAEQQKIAAILDAADSLRQKDQQLIDHYTTLSQSLFLDMFGDPVVNPMGWERALLGDGLMDIVGGKSVGGEERQLKGNEKAVLKISAVTTGAFDSTQYKVVAKAAVPNVLVHPKKGDLLFSRANTRELVGAVCIVDGQYDDLFLPDKLWRLDLKTGGMSAWYVKYLLTHDGFRENLRKVATGTSGSMLNISKAKLKKLSIPLPPFILQNKFAERIQAIEAQKQQAQASLKKSNDLFNSLLQLAFKGELTT